MVDTEDGESDDDISDELPVVTYACLAFQTLYFYIHGRSNIEVPFELLSRLDDQLMRYRNRSISCTQRMIMVYKINLLTLYSLYTQSKECFSVRIQISQVFFH